MTSADQLTPLRPVNIKSPSGELDSAHMMTSLTIVSIDLLGVDSSLYSPFSLSVPPSLQCLS